MDDFERLAPFEYDGHRLSAEVITQHAETVGPGLPMPLALRWTFTVDGVSSMGPLWSLADTEESIRAQLIATIQGR